MNQYQNSFLNPYGFGQQIQPPVYAPPAQQVVKVNGEGGARAYQIGANSSAMLLDESGLIVWFITTDGAGYKTVSAYDITPHKAAPSPDYDSLENRIKRLEEIVNGNTGNSSAAEPKQPVPGGAAGAADDGRGAYRAEPAGHAKPAYHEQPAAEAGDGYRTPVWRGSDDGIQNAGGGKGYKSR